GATRGRRALDSHPLFASFDIVLKRFNAVSTYSGPAVIRLLRAGCGQPRHPVLYAAAPAPPGALRARPGPVPPNAGPAGRRARAAARPQPRRPLRRVPGPRARAG